ncbi:MAG: transglycosylase SLT domain-containing protein [Rubrivivax sp.]|nr:transglycosylase SLT domain-containing protein [Rubrivivax sp.]
MTGAHAAGPRGRCAPDAQPSWAPQRRSILESSSKPGRRWRRLAAGAAATAALLLAGCATGPVPGSPTAGEAADTAAVKAAAAPPAAAAARAPAAASSSAPAYAVDPEAPATPYDFAAPSVHTDLWVRVRAGFAMPELNNDIVQKWEQWYAGRPDYVQRMTERGGRYLFYVVEEIDKRGMPTELALLPFIESAFNPQAMSVARASGMWQFMPATGRDFDLTQNLFRDDRRDVLQSTRAALDYLQMLQRQFGDWQLALAAYNWGQGNVQRAIERNRKSGMPETYEALRMPDETRNYVPKLQAVKNIVLRPEAYALALPELRNHPYFLSVPITRDIDVEVAARLAGVPLEEFKQLNPQLNKPVILAAGTPQVLLPYANANEFVRRLDAHRGAFATWTAWVAPRTLKPSEAAQHLGIDEADLRSINRIPAGMVIKAGSTLLVPRQGRHDADVPEAVADNATMQLAPDRPPGKRIAIRAGKSGLSVVTVARRYRVGVDQVAQWNGVPPTAVFKSGQTIVIYKPVAAGPVRAAARPASRSAAAKPAAAKGRQSAAAKAPAAASAKSGSRAPVAAKKAPQRPIASSNGTRREARL